jgi:hypothetical protein
MMGRASIIQFLLACLPPNCCLTQRLQAGAYGIRLILAIGNLWPEYVGPEVFLTAAGESGG